MSFYNRGYSGLVRFPGLGRYGAFGDVSEAEEAVRVAEAKVAKATADLNKQKKLVAFTQNALRECTARPTAVAFLTAGASIAVCVAEQETALGQRKGVLGQFELILSEAREELKAAKAALAAARIQEQEAPPEELPEVTPTGGGPGPGPTGGPRPAPKSIASSAGGLFDSPLKIAMVTLPVLGGLAYVMMRKPARVASYRRYRR